MEDKVVGCHPFHLPLALVRVNLSLNEIPLVLWKTKVQSLRSEKEAKKLVFRHRFLNFSFLQVITTESSEALSLLVNPISIVAAALSVPSSLLNTKQKLVHQP